MRGILVVALVVFGAAAASAAPLVVDCDRGDSLSRTLERLSRLSPLLPFTVSVKGTCAEYVQVHGFDGLTLKGLPGATLAQPSADPDPVVQGVLTIAASRSVTVDGFSVHSDGANAVAVRGGSSDVRLRNISADGLLIVIEGSQVSLAGITVRDPVTWAAVAVYDMSDVFLEDCLLETAISNPYIGVDISRAKLTMHGTVIRGFRLGMSIGFGGHIDVMDFDNFIPMGGPAEVLIESPAGTNYDGCRVNGGRLAVGVPLRITNAGQQGWDWTASVHVSNGGSLIAGPNLDVSGSRGQGILVEGNSLASLGASTITGGLRGGLVVMNQSTVTLDGTTLSGNATDVFCDSRSLITGGASIVGAANIQCDQLLPGAYESSLP
jgi:hypothetical protein